MYKIVDKEAKRKKRHLRIRKKVSGTQDMPRMSVFRSLKNISVQLIDDEKGCTIVSASTMDKEMKDVVKFGGNMEAAKILGKKVAERALKAGIKKVVFDRSGYLYTGRVKALAEEARSEGLEF